MASRACTEGAARRQQDPSARTRRAELTASGHPRAFRRAASLTSPPHGDQKVATSTAQPALRCPWGKPANQEGESSMKTNLWRVILPTLIIAVAGDGISFVSAAWAEPLTDDFDEDAKEPPPSGALDFRTMTFG